jgi:hypothetical protein
MQSVKQFIFDYLSIFVKGNLHDREERQKHLMQDYVGIFIRKVSILMNTDMIPIKEYFELML